MTRIVAIKVEKDGDERVYTAYVKNGRRRQALAKFNGQAMSKAEKATKGAELDGLAKQQAVK